MIGAGGSHEDPAAGQEFHGPKIDLLVSAERSRHGLLGLGEGGGVEDDEIEVPPPLFEPPELVKGVSPPKAATIREVVQLGILRRTRDRLRRDVDPFHRPRTGLGRVQAKPPRIAEAIQDLSAGSQRAHGQPVVPLIQKETGLLSRGDVHLKAEVRFLDGDDRVEEVSQNGFLQGETFQQAGRRIIPEEDPAGMEKLLDHWQQDSTEPLHSGGQDL